MSLLVLDPSGELAQIGDQLEAAGYEANITHDTKHASALCAAGTYQMLICSGAVDLDDLDCPISTPWIVLAHNPLSIDYYDQALLKGASDVVHAPTCNGELIPRLSKVLERRAQLVGSINEKYDALSRELEKDQKAGQYIQMGMLPPNPMGIGNYRLQHKVSPSLMLSGDFVDYFQLTDRYFACYVADVSGHGASSAFVTVLLKNFSRRLRREYRPAMLKDPGQILAWINDELLEQAIDKHVALFFGLIDMQQNELLYSNGAQFPPPMLVCEGKIKDLGHVGKPLGLFADTAWQSDRVAFPAGTRLVVCSDGILDLVAGDNLNGKEQVLHELAQQHDNVTSFWQQLDLTKLGADDVSCLMVCHED